LIETRAAEFAPAGGVAPGLVRLRAATAPTVALIYLDEADGPACPATLEELRRSPHLLIGSVRSSVSDDVLPLARAMDLLLCEPGASVPRDLDYLMAPAGALATVRELGVAEPDAASVALTALLRSRHFEDVGAGLFVESLAYSMLLASGDFQRWLNTR
jgi:hypothetical protein